MRTAFAVPLLLAAAACAGPHYAERTDPVPVTAPPASPASLPDSKVIVSPPTVVVNA